MVGQEDNKILASEKGGVLLRQGYVLHFLDFVGERRVQNNVDRPHRPEKVDHLLIVHTGRHSALPVEGQAAVKEHSFDILLLLGVEEKLMRSVTVLLKFAGVVGVEEFADNFLVGVWEEGKLVVLHFFVDGFFVVLGPVAVGTGLLKHCFIFAPP